eukprot:1285810-Alexandrium_andersonii.AAC.1
MNALSPSAELHPHSVRSMWKARQGENGGGRVYHLIQMRTRGPTRGNVRAACAGLPAGDRAF